MDRQVKGPATKPDQLSSVLLPHSRRTEPTPMSCPLNSSYTMARVCACRKADIQTDTEREEREREHK